MPANGGPDVEARVTDDRLSAALEKLTDWPSARSFRDLPDRPGFWYAVWLDKAGAAELSAHTPEPVRPGIVYAGECVTQSVRRHLMHNDLGSLTLMKNLAAILREPWSLRAERRGDHLVEPGRRKLLDWMDDHLTATIAPRAKDISTRDVLAALDPPLRLVGWGPERTPLRRHISEQRSVLGGSR